MYFPRKKKMYDVKNITRDVQQKMYKKNVQQIYSGKYTAEDVQRKIYGWRFATESLQQKNVQIEKEQQKM